MIQCFWQDMNTEVVFTWKINILALTFFFVITGFAAFLFVCFMCLFFFAEGKKVLFGGAGMNGVPVRPSGYLWARGL